MIELEKSKTFNRKTKSGSSSINVAPFDVPVIWNRSTFARPFHYSDLDLLQQSIRDELYEGKRETGVLLLSEVEPVITEGVRALASDRVVAPDFFKQKGIEIYACNRGGKSTYHGPGQWVVFAVEHMQRLVGEKIGVKKLICGLLEAAQATALHYQVKAAIRSGDHLGLWSEKGKIASVGVRIEKGIAQHGLALNVVKKEPSFFGIRPCGLDVQPDYLFSTPITDDQFLEVGKVLASKILDRFWQG